MLANGQREALDLCTSLQSHWTLSRNSLKKDARKQRCCVSLSSRQENASLEKTNVLHFKKNLLIPNRLVGNQSQTVS